MIQKKLLFFHGIIFLVVIFTTKKMLHLCIVQCCQLWHKTFDRKIKSLHFFAGSLTRSGYAPSSLQPQLYPLRPRGGHHMVMPDEQYPTMPFRSPYIHTADSGPSAIVYYPQKSRNHSYTPPAPEASKMASAAAGSTSTFQPIYESIGKERTKKY